MTNINKLPKKREILEKLIRNFMEIYKEEGLLRKIFSGEINDALKQVENDFESYLSSKTKEEKYRKLNLLKSDIKVLNDLIQKKSSKIDFINARDTILKETEKYRRMDLFFDSINLNKPKDIEDALVRLLDQHKECFEIIKDNNKTKKEQKSPEEPSKSRQQTQDEVRRANQPSKSRQQTQDEVRRTNQPSESRPQTQDEVRRKNQPSKSRPQTQDEVRRTNQPSESRPKIQDEGKANQPSEPRPKIQDEGRANQPSEPRPQTSYQPSELGQQTSDKSSEQEQTPYQSTNSSQTIDDPGVIKYNIIMHTLYYDKKQLEEDLKRLDNYEIERKKLPTTSELVSKEDIIKEVNERMKYRIYFETFGNESNSISETIKGHLESSDNSNKYKERLQILTQHMSSENISDLIGELKNTIDGFSRNINQDVIDKISNIIFGKLQEIYDTRIRKEQGTVKDEQETVGNTELSPAAQTMQKFYQNGFVSITPEEFRKLIEEIENEKDDKDETRLEE